MFKTNFQKMILAVPLKPFTAIVFSFLIGYLGVFLPRGHINVTVQTSQGESVINAPVHDEVDWRVEINDCSIRVEEWLSEPSLFFRMEGVERLSFSASIIILLQYLRFVPKTPRSLWAFFFASMTAAFVPIGFMVWFMPHSLNCDLSAQAVVNSFSISWFACFVWLFGPLLGLYAVQRRALMEKQKADQL
ncbi:MAG: hypothetical protein HY869_21635 [Chloroflexi bacterium]|nr:hypothetical protein [Chloroflexota bacterium]